MPTTPTPATTNPSKATAICAPTPGTWVLSTATNQPSTATISPKILMTFSFSTNSQFGGRGTGRRRGPLRHLAVFQRFDLVKPDQGYDEKSQARHCKYESKI